MKLLEIELYFNDAGRLHSSSQDVLLSWHVLWSSNADKAVEETAVKYTKTNNFHNSETMSPPPSYELDWAKNLKIPPQQLQYHSVPVPIVQDISRPFALRIQGPLILNLSIWHTTKAADKNNFTFNRFTSYN